MTRPFTASAEPTHTLQEVVDFLADLRNHALLASSSVKLRARVLGTDSVQAIARLSGPLAIRRTATTAIMHSRQPAVIAGRARIGRRTQTSISWTIAGRRWCQRRFANALGCPAHQLAAAASPQACTDERLRLHPAPRPAA